MVAACQPLSWMLLLMLGLVSRILQQDREGGPLLAD
jgi:hypothetical protein